MPTKNQIDQAPLIRKRVSIMMRNGFGPTVIAKRLTNIFKRKFTRQGAKFYMDSIVKRDK